MNSFPATSNSSTAPAARYASRRSKPSTKRLNLAARPDVILVSYGDMLRVPGSHADLFTRQSRGRRCASRLLSDRSAQNRPPEPRAARSSSSPSDSRPPLRPTPWPSGRPNASGIGNFSVLVSHVLVPPAIRALMTSPDCRVNGFIAPGHVCTVMGYDEYEALARDFRVPIVVGGFEPVDLLEAVLMLVRQLEQGRGRSRKSIRPLGELPGQPARPARGRRSIRDRRPEVARHWHHPAERPACARSMATTMHRASSTSASITRRRARRMHQREGAARSKKPTDCAAFGMRCTPHNPLGAPMVSSEGACAAYYNYRRSLVPDRGKPWRRKPTADHNSVARRRCPRTTPSCSATAAEAGSART